MIPSHLARTPGEIDFERLAAQRARRWAMGLRLIIMILIVGQCLGALADAVYRNAGAPTNLLAPVIGWHALAAIPLAVLCLLIFGLLSNVSRAAGGFLYASWCWFLAIEVHAWPYTAIMTILGCLGLILMGTACHSLLYGDSHDRLPA